jgi:hypothetical protein
VKEREGIVVHPTEEHYYRLIAVEIAGTTGFDPPTNHIADELAEIATRIVQFIGFGRASGEKCLVKCTSAFRVALDELFDPRRERLQPVHERETFTVANEGTRPQRDLDLTLKGIRLWARTPSHRPSFEFATALDLMLVQRI